MLHPIRIFLFFALFFISAHSQAQSRIFIETLGSTSALAGAVSYEKLFELSENQSLGLNAGFGLRHSGTNGPNFWLYKGGISYYRNTWGIGVDAAFHNRLEKVNFNTYSEVRTIIYPHLSYTWEFWEDWFLQPSIGYAFYYNHVVNAWFQPEQNRVGYWTSTPFPQLGLWFGVRLN